MTDSQAIRLTLAICTHNRSCYARDAVVSVLETCQELSCRWEVLVIANGCTDDTCAALRSIEPKDGLILIEEPTLGLSHARNRAVAVARGDYIVFLDDDVIAPAGYASAIYEAIEAGGWDIIGGAVVPEWEANPPRWVGKDLYGYLGLLEEETGVVENGWPRVIGANMGFRTSLLKTMGRAPFHPKLGRTGRRLLGGEESVLIETLHSQGARIGFSTAAYIRHRIPPSRLSLRYFLRWTYAGGISDCRASILKLGCRRLPRWVVHELLKRSFMVPWLLIIGRRDDAVRSMLGASRRLGRVAEYVRSGFRRS